jgi:hypothetical protein
MKYFLFFSIALLDLKQKYQDSYVDPDILDWSYFKGTIDSTKNFESFCDSKIQYAGYNLGNGTKYMVLVTFLSSSSWVNMPLISANVEKNKLNQTKYLAKLLIHEKGHYLITIITAKKFKQYTLNHQDASTKEIDSIYDNYSTSLNARELSYDMDTDHSRNISAQLDWNRLLSSEMDSLKSITIDNNYLKKQTNTFFK